MTRQPGRPGITEADVVVAIEQLRSRRRPITYGALREALGKGSHSTIQKHLNAILDRQDIGNEPASTIPSELSSRGENLVREIWEKAHQIAQAEAISIREQAFQKAERLEQQVEELSAMLDASERSLESMQRQLAANERKAARLKAQCSKHEAEAALMREQLENWVARNATA